MSGRNRMWRFLYDRRRLASNLFAEDRLLRAVSSDIGFEIADVHESSFAGACEKYTRLFQSQNPASSTTNYISGWLCGDGGLDFVNYVGNGFSPEVIESNTSGEAYVCIPAGVERLINFYCGSEAIIKFCNMTGARGDLWESVEIYMADRDLLLACFSKYRDSFYIPNIAGLISKFHPVRVSASMIKHYIIYFLISHELAHYGIRRGESYRTIDLDIVHGFHPDAQEEVYADLLAVELCGNYRVAIGAANFFEMNQFFDRFREERIGYHPSGYERLAALRQHCLNRQKDDRSFRIAHDYISSMMDKFDSQQQYLCDNFIFNIMEELARGGRFAVGDDPTFSAKMFAFCCMSLFLLESVSRGASKVSGVLDYLHDNSLDIYRLRAILRS